MANQRSQDLQNVTMWLHRDFLASIERARARLREDRSTFIRKSIEEKLERMEIAFDPEKAGRPDRARRTIYPEPAAGGLAMNDEGGASSAPAAASAEDVAKASAEAAKRALRRAVGGPSGRRSRRGGGDPGGPGGRR